MRLRHKVPLHLRQASEPEPISERYQAEIDRTLRRAERAWRNAERQHQKAEKRQQKTPNPANSKALELVRKEAERLWLEYQRLDQLMRGAPVSGANHTGRGSVRRVGQGGSGE